MRAVRTTPFAGHGVTAPAPRAPRRGVDPQPVEARLKHVRRSRKDLDRAPPPSVLERVRFDSDRRAPMGNAGSLPLAGRGRGGGDAGGTAALRSAPPPPPAPPRKGEESAPCKADSGSKETALALAKQCSAAGPARTVRIPGLLRFAREDDQADVLDQAENALAPPPRPHPERLTEKPLRPVDLPHPESLTEKPLVPLTPLILRCGDSRREGGLKRALRGPKVSFEACAAIRRLNMSARDVGSVLHGLNAGAHRIAPMSMRRRSPDPRLRE